MFVVRAIIAGVQLTEISLNAGQPRGVLSTIIMTVIGSAFAGFLWIGRPRLAVVSFLLPILLVFATAWRGFPIWPTQELDIISITWLALTAASLLAVLAFRKSSHPGKWHSRWYFALLLAFGVTIMIAPIIRSFVVQPFRSPSSSMAPALVEGDRFFVNKAAYGYSKHSLPFELIEFSGRIWPIEPERGDIVVLKSEAGLDYVKRLIGLPGETIRISNGIVFIDGVPTQLHDDGKGSYDADGGVGRLLRETLPNGVSYDVIDLETDSAGDNTREFLVPDGQYFVLGDHRDNSNDSRFSLGFVPFERLIGRAERIFWNSEGTSYSERQDLRPH
jgi:signal peptidase I